MVPILTLFLILQAIDIIDEVADLVNIKYSKRKFSKYMYSEDDIKLIGVSI